MGIFDGCLLACDIDGTLISNGVLPPKNVEKIKYFISEGGKFCLSSGRSAEGIMPVVRRLCDISASIVQNGAVIYDSTEKKVLKQNFLEEADKCFVKHISENFKNVGIKVHVGDVSYTLNRNEEVIDHETYEELRPIDVTYNDIKDIKWCKAIFFPPDSETYEKVVALTPEKHNSRFVRTNAFVYGRMRHYYEQLPNGVSKASALADLKEIYNISDGNVFAIGDYYNDLEMICAADIGAATEESPDDIKKKARYITCPCADGAVADFIDYLTKVKGE